MNIYSYMKNNFVLLTILLYSFKKVSSSDLFIFNYKEKSIFVV